MSPSAAAATTAATAAVGVPVQISSSWGASHQQQQRNVDVGGGLISLTAHALQLCAHAARCHVQDLQTTPWAWRTLPTYTSKHQEEDMKDGATSTNPASASSPWTYVQHALLYHRQHVPTTRKEAEDDLDKWLGHWDETSPTTSTIETQPPLPTHLLGRISLCYVSSRELTQDELKNPHVVPQEEEDEEEEEEDEDIDEDIDEDDDEVMDGSSKQKSSNHQSSTTQSASGATAPPPEVLSSSFWRRFGSNSSVVVLLYHAVVEYRSLPATGNPWAVQAEAWSMMTWGQGSPLDEELKWAALAGLSDPQSKYRLEIESVRGKRYQFDWIPATSPPPLIHIEEDDDDDDDDDDVFDHNSSQWAQCLGVRVSDKPETLASLLPSHHSFSKWALTRMQYRLDTKSASRDALYSAASFFQQQQQKDQSSATVGLYRVSKLLQDHFLQLNPQPPTLIRAYPSGHALILTPVKTGRSLGQVYWQGRFWKHWNKTNDDDHTNDDEVDDVWNHVPALFGMNLNAPFPLTGGGGGPTATMTTPLVQGQPPPPRPGSGSGSSDSPKRRTSVTIVDVPMSSASPSTLLKQAYAVMWQELLIDARYERWDLAGKLLNRLIYDVDQADEEDDEILAQEFEEDETNQKNGRQVNSGSTSPLIIWPQHPPPSANVDCLESIVLQSNVFDPVGIAAKALATHFAQAYGANAFPCLSHEVEWVKHELPKQRPIVVVPMRALNVLRRGGYFDVARTKQDMLLEQQQQQVVGSNPPSPPDLKEKVLHLACGLLDQAEGSTGYRILHQERSWRELVILVPAEEDQPLCTFDAFSNVFRIRDDFLTLDWSSRLGTPFCVNEQDESSISTAAFLLGMYMAQVHPSGSDVLVRYIFQNARLPTK